jgi:hypothetical protein
MKVRGYRIVHVVPATPERPATPTEPPQWQLHPASEMVAVSRWPKIPTFASAGPAALPAPALSDLDWRDADFAARPAQRRGRGVPLPQVALWSRQTVLPPPGGAVAALPVPAASIFRMPESASLTMLAAATRRAEPAARAPRATEVSAKQAGKTRRQGHAAVAQPSPSTAEQPPEHADASAAKPALPAKKKNGRSVRVAGLKKRGSVVLIDRIRTRLQPFCLEQLSWCGRVRALLPGALRLNSSRS